MQRTECIWTQNVSRVLMVHVIIPGQGLITASLSDYLGSERTLSVTSRSSFKSPQPNFFSVLFICVEKCTVQYAVLQRIITTGDICWEGENILEATQEWRNVFFNTSAVMPKINRGCVYVLWTEWNFTVCLFFFN